MTEPRNPKLARIKVGDEAFELSLPAVVIRQTWRRGSKQGRRWWFVDPLISRVHVNADVNGLLFAERVEAYGRSGRIGPYPWSDEFIDLATESYSLRTHAMAGESQRALDEIDGKILATTFHADILGDLVLDHVAVGTGRLDSLSASDHLAARTQAGDGSAKSDDQQYKWIQQVVKNRPLNMTATAAVMAEPGGWKSKSHTRTMLRRAVAAGYLEEHEIHGKGTFL